MPTNEELRQQAVEDAGGYRFNENSRNLTKYHTDPDCNVGKSISNPIPVDPDERPDLDECKFCADAVDRSTPDRSIYDAAVGWSQDDGGSEAMEGSP